MNKLHDIPITVEFSDQPESMLLPILHEMTSLLAKLAATGQPSIIDLRHEPLSLGDIVELKNILGQGEIQAHLTTLGASQIIETEVPGIWWISHYNEQGNVISEFIEITPCPDLLKTFDDELDSALAGLKDKISQYTQRSTTDQVERRLKELGYGKGNETDAIN